MREETDMSETKKITGYPSIDKPWMKYYPEESENQPISNNTLYQNVLKHNQKNMNQFALEYYGNRVTYRQFFEKVDTISKALVHIGVSEGDIVSVALLGSIDAIALIYAINKIGAVSNLISGISDVKDLKFFLQNTGSEYLFVLDNFLKTFLPFLPETNIKKVIVLNLTDDMGIISKYGARLLKGIRPIKLKKDLKLQSWKEFILLGKDREEKEGGRSEDVALICYTGGTTGQSKAVELTNYACNATAEQYLIGGADVHSGQLWLNYIPVFVAFGMVTSIHLALLGGNEIILRISNSEHMTVALKKYKINHVVYGPHFWEELADDNEKIDLSNIIEPTCGGDSLPLSVEKKINEYLTRNGAKYPILNGYGMTEVSAAVAVNSIRAHKYGSVGIPLCKNVVSAFDINDNSEKKYNQEGEICILTPSVMNGYLNMPEETDNIIRVHSDGLSWVHTGDFGYVDEDGFIFISGRLKRFFLYKRVGFVKKVFCLEIEKILMQNKNIENCAVVPIPDENHQQVAKAYIKIKNEAETTFDIIRSDLEQRFSAEDESLRPVEYSKVDVFPLTSIGKIDYKKLEEISKRI